METVFHEKISKPRIEQRPSKNCSHLHRFSPFDVCERVNQSRML
jgi:hypothetical protein